MKKLCRGIVRVFISLELSRVHDGKIDDDIKQLRNEFDKNFET